VNYPGEFGALLLGMIAASNRVGENYKKRTALQPEFYISKIGDGVKKIG